MWLPDSNVLRAFFARSEIGHAQAVAHGDAVGWDNIAIPVVVLAEVMQGRLRYLDEAFRRSQLHLIDAFARLHESFASLTTFEVLPVSASAVEVYRGGELPGSMSRNDRLIAAVALAGNQILVTRNVGHFQGISGLRIENWIDDPLS